MSELEKIAQRRSLWNKVRPSNVTRQIAKINPEYKEQYAILERLDDSIREKGAELGQNIKALKSAHKNHKWFSVFDYCARINNIVKDVISDPLIPELIEIRKQHVKDFYFEGEKGLPARASYRHSLTKQALFEGLSRRMVDTFFGFRGDEEKKVRLVVNNLANRAKTLGQRMVQVYKALDTARAKGSISDYISNILSLKSEQEKFDTVFDQSYNAVQEFLPKQVEKSVEKVEPKSVSKSAPKINNEFPEIKPFGPQGLENPDIVVHDQPEMDLAQMAREIDTGHNIETEQRGTQVPLESDVDVPEDLYPLGKAAKLAIKQGNYGIAAQLLVTYSDQLDAVGLINESHDMLNLAQELLDA